MTISHFKHRIINLVAATALLTPLVMTAGVQAVPKSGADSTNATSQAATEATHLANIKTRGSAEIDRRLTALNGLITKISSATKLSAASRASLVSEVNTEITDLTALRVKLNAETTISAAAADVTSMVTEYRVYALIMPKVALVKTADDQLAAEAKLTALATKISTRLTQAQTAGKNVATLSVMLTDMQAKVAAAQTISTKVETSVLALLPTDYDTNHSVLGGYRDQLKTAHADNQAAYNDAKTIITDLKTL